MSLAYYCPFLSPLLYKESQGHVFVLPSVFINFLFYFLYVVVCKFANTEQKKKKKKSKTGGLVGFQILLTSKDISDKAAKLISDSRREGSIYSYESARRYWAGWCGKRKVDTFRCFCGMVDRRKAFSLISSQDHCQRSSPSRISDTP